jgi:hypothetical protein
LPWGSDWLWGVPVLVLAVIAHVCAIVFTAKILSRKIKGEPRDTMRFVVVVAFTTLGSTALIAVEGGAWAGLYLWLGALPDMRAAMLYSLEAMTSYGHADIFLESRWQLLGAIEAVNGLILFGLTTAFLIAVIQQVWPLREI